MLVQLLYFSVNPLQFNFKRVQYENIIKQQNVTFAAFFLVIVTSTLQMTSGIV